MKTLTLTTLTITAYLILAHLLPFSGVAANRKPVVSKNVAGQNVPVSSVAIKSVGTNGIGTTAVGTISVVPAGEDPVGLANTAVAVAEPVVELAPVAEVVDEAPAVEVVASPELDGFVAQVTNGQPGQVVGAYVEGVLALPVVQQPSGQANFVSVKDNVTTQFHAAAANGTIGLLAHNYLAGRFFPNLQQDQEAVIVYGDGRLESYRINRVQRYQALDPTNAYSNFVDLNDPAQPVLTAGQLFSRVYGNANQVVFQTCIDAHGNSSWGRLFVTAEKIGG